MALLRASNYTPSFRLWCSLAGKQCGHALQQAPNIFCSFAAWATSQRVAQNFKTSFLCCSPNTYCNAVDNGDSHISHFIATYWKRCTWKVFFSYRTRNYLKLNWTRSPNLHPSHKGINLTLKPRNMQNTPSNLERKALSLWLTLWDSAFQGNSILTPLPVMLQLLQMQSWLKPWESDTSNTTRSFCSEGYSTLPV